jgi:hypothetical protein
MNKLSLLTSAFALAAATTGFSSAPTNAQQTSKPNVIMIMTDDVGWGDLGSYGGGTMRGAPQSGHPKLTDQCPLSGVKRTSRFQRLMSAFDPNRTLVIAIPAEIFALQHEI